MNSSESLFLLAIEGFLGGVPMTPDPNTSAQVSQYQWEAYRDTNWCIRLSAKRMAYLCESIAIEMGGVSRYFSKVLGSRIDVPLLIFAYNLSFFTYCGGTASKKDQTGFPDEGNRRV